MTELLLKIKQYTNKDLPQEDSDATDVKTYKVPIIDRHLETLCAVKD